MTPQNLDFAVVGPLVAVGVGAMAVLLGEVLLSGAKTFLGRTVTESYVGSVLAACSIFFLALAVYMAVGHAISGGARPLNPANPMFQLDRYSALMTAVISFAALLSCALSIAYLDELRINHGEYYALVLFSTAGMLLRDGGAEER